MAKAKFFTKTVTESSKPINMVVSSPLGIGTISLLQSELEAQGSRFVFFNAAREGADLAYQASNNEVHLARDLELADTLIVDDMRNVTPSLAALVHELVRQRTVIGRELPSLRNVVLVYGRHEAAPVGPDLIDMESGFATIRITR